MAPAKRKSSNATLGASFYQLQGSTSSKKRLVLEEEGGEVLSRTSTNMSTTRSTHGLTSPSLENITTDLRASFPKSAASSSVTPVTPDTTHSIVPPPPQSTLSRPKSYLIVGASRGIGLEFTRQLLQRQCQVIAVVRDPNTASKLWQVTGSIITRPGSCIIEQCDVGNPLDIEAFVSRMRLFVERGGSIDHIILNAGILDYEQGLGALQVEFDQLDRHLRVNCIGNIVLARKLLMLNDSTIIQQRREHAQLEDNGDVVLVGAQVIFMSSDSGSMADFREYEDGFAAYGASKVALNMMIRHLAAELKRRALKKQEEAKADWQSRDEPMNPWESVISVLAMHPGEVSTEMANVELGWEVEGIITAEESVRDMLNVLEGKDSTFSGTFWRWDGTQHPW